MPITLPGDKEFEKRPSIERKALKINLNDRIYGTFAEIGAGHETGNSTKNAFLIDRSANTFK